MTLLASTVGFFPFFSFYMISISGGFGRLGLSGLFRCRVSFSCFDYIIFSPFLPAIVYPPLDSSKKMAFGVAVLPACLDLILREIQSRTDPPLECATSSVC